MYLHIKVQPSINKIDGDMQQAVRKPSELPYASIALRIMGDWGTVKKMEGEAWKGRVG